MANESRKLNFTGRKWSVKTLVCAGQISAVKTVTKADGTSFKLMDWVDPQSGEIKSVSFTSAEADPAKLAAGEISEYLRINDDGAQELAYKLCRPQANVAAQSAMSFFGFATEEV